MIKLLIADDHHLFREGLSRILDDASGFQVVGAVSSGEDAIYAVTELTPDVVLLDIHMPGMGGLAAAEQLHKHHPDLGIIMLTVSEDENDLFAAVRAGARGYLLKNSTAAELSDGIRQVHAGKAAISPAMSVKLLDQFVSSQPAASPRPTDALTDREQDVLKLVARGMSNREIGVRLSISPHTVKAHLRHILDKLNLRSRSEAAAWAERQGLTREG
ncbi:MAG TPA: response regulator transcription factor [Caldilineae bacterium]|nr:response regulator transcription factor [Caldilineae bacterium]